MGYWLVVLMATCAVAATLLVVAAEWSPETRARRRRPNGSLRWLAVIGAEPGSATDWPAALRDGLPTDVEGEVVEAGSRTLRDIGPILEQSMDDRDVDVVVLWVALGDILAGVALEDHERSLHGLLDGVRSRGAVPVVGGVPDLTTWRVAEEAGLPPDELAGLIARWNAAIARVVHAAGGMVADLNDLDETGSKDAETIARHVLPPLRRALILAHRRTAAVGPALQ
jgi:hypothetical protein